MSIQYITCISDSSSKEESSSHSGNTTDADSEGSKLELNIPQELEPEGRRKQLDSTLDNKSELEMRWQGFKIVGDNIDKNIRPSMQRLTHQTRSLHNFHSYAVKDRVSFRYYAFS